MLVSSFLLQSVLAQDNSHLATDSLDALPFLRVNVCDSHTFISSVYLIRTVSVKQPRDFGDDLAP